MINIENLAEINSLYEFYKGTFLSFKENTFDGMDINYENAFKMVKARAGFLQDRGYRKGDIIGILALNSTEWLLSYMAVTTIGAVVLPLDTNLDYDTYKTMLDQVEAKGLFVSNNFDFKFENIDVIDIEADIDLIFEDKFFVADVNASDISTLLYTSGTTGTPKIVQLTHGNMYKASIGGNSFVKVAEGSLVLCMLPFYHIFGLHSTFLATFGVGSGYVCQPSLTAPEILRSLKENEINVFPAVPKLWEMMIDGIINKVKNSSKIKYSIFMFNLKHGRMLRRIGLGFIPKTIFKPVHAVFGESIHYLVTGGAPFKKTYFDYYYNMGFKIMEGYGLTETTSAICASDRNQYKPAQSGRPLPGNEIKIKNSNDKGIGEIWFRGDNVFPGYYKNEEATAEVFDSEGWFNSGDLGYTDRDGELHVTGREKNLIVLDSGKNVYPEELEAFYIDSPIISEIAVFGKMEQGKECVYSVIVPSRVDIKYSDIKKEINRLNAGRPTYKSVADFAISYDTLPKTSKRTNINSKIIQNLNEGLYSTGERDVSVIKEITSDDPEKQNIINILKGELKQDNIYYNQSISDFNIDSLGVMNLIVQLEVKLSIKIEESVFSSIESIDAVINYLSSCEKGDGRSTFDELVSGKITTKSISFFNPLFELMLQVFRILSKLFWRVKVYNRENIDFKNSIVAVNHQSLLDILILLSSLSYRVRKDMFITAKKELTFLKFLFPGISYVFVDRSNNSLPALKAGADLLRQGKTLVIFPEGTRTKDGRLSEFKTGAAFLAKELKKNIIPMAIDGAFKVMPQKSFFPRLFTKQRISLTILKKIRPENYLNFDNLNKALFKSIKGGLVRSRKS
jgi:long-chain acyl-CoA synthetase